MLDQACAHCPIFPTAASRRSLGRVSVPVWPIALSGRLSIVAMVGRYPTIKLIERGPLQKCQLTCIGQLSLRDQSLEELCGISPSFPRLSPAPRQVTHVLLTRSPLYSSTEVDFLARLACVKHAASVHSEPGSNSPVENPDRHRPANASTAFVYLIQSPLSRRSQRFTYHWRYCLVRQLLPMRNRHWFPSIQFSKNRPQIVGANLHSRLKPT